MSNVEQVFLKPDTDQDTWPLFTKPLSGLNRVFVENHTGRDMWFALRLGDSGVDVWLASGDKTWFSLPPGSYGVYACIYPGGIPTLVEAEGIEIPDGIRTIRTLQLWGIEGARTTSDFRRLQKTSATRKAFENAGVRFGR